MTTIQIATRIDVEEKKLFEETTRAIGLTPADALRVFIKAFDKEGGFPFIPNTFPKNSDRLELEQKKLNLSKKIQDLYKKGDLKRLNTNKNGVILVPKDDSLNKDWIRESWVM